MLSLRNLLYDKALPLFNKRIRINNKESTHNVWFNDDCKIARSQFDNARNVYSKHKSEVNRKHFTRLRTLYNKTRRKTVNNHKTQEGKRICDLSKKDPK